MGIVIYGGPNASLELTLCCMGLSGRGDYLPGHTGGTSSLMLHSIVIRLRGGQSRSESESSGRSNLNIIQVFLFQASRLFDALFAEIYNRTG
jgi:hypothetical protein